MTDHDALLQAICHSADDDTPRLIYADFLEESGEADRAEFVRAQVELARTPDWEPFAVLCRARKLEWSEVGFPFLTSLPPLGPDVSWHPQPFRRGLGWRVRVANLRTWNAIAPQLYESASVGELDLRPAATRDEWQAFAAGEWVKHFRIIHLDGTSPVEAIRALCDNPAACGITDLHFDRASSPGLPELVEDLLATPLGKGLKGLHFAAGFQTVSLLIDVLRDSKVRLKRLSFKNMKLNSVQVERLLNTTIASELEELSLSQDRLRDRGEWEDPWPGDPEWMSQLPSTLRSLCIVDGNLGRSDFEAFAEEPFHPELRALDLSRNYSLRHAYDFFDYRSMSPLKMVSLRSCSFEPESWRRLVQSRLWLNATCLDLSGNPITDTAARRLLEAPLSPNLVALVIDRPQSETAAADLREKFGEVLVVENDAKE